MVARPTNLPRWANTGGAQYTEPTEGLKNTGFVANDPPRRVIVNWLFRRGYEAFQWLLQSESRTSDVFEDQGLPGEAGDRPTTGAGVGPLAVDDFTGSAYANGYRVPPTDGPGAGTTFSYGTDDDTYWDLSSAGVWTAVAVPNDDPEPALTASSVRMYMVRTESSVRLAFGSGSIDYRATRIRATEPRDDVDVRVGVLSSLKGLVADAAELVGFRREYAVDLTSAPNYRYQAWVRWNDLTGAVFGARIYTRRIVGDAIQTVLVLGADCTTPQGAAASDVVWTARETSAHRFVLRTHASSPVLRYSRITGLTPGGTFTEAAWEDATPGNATRYQLPLGFGFKFGGAPMNPSTANGNIVPIIGEIIRATGSTLTDLIADTTAGIMPWRHYTGAALDGGLTAPMWAVNATYRPATDDWIQYSSHASYLLSLSSNGLHLYWHDGSIPGTTWAHTVDPATWTLLAKIGGTSLVNPFPTAATPQGAAKAFGYVLIDNAGAVVSSRLYGCTLAPSGSPDLNAITVTLTTAMPTTSYAVFPGGNAQNASPPIIADTSHFDVFAAQAFNLNPGNVAIWFAAFGS